MSKHFLHVLYFVLALGLAGCSVVPEHVARAVQAGGLAVAAPSLVVASGTGAPNDSDESLSRAIQVVIQRANQGQQDAFSQGNPAIMRDTATDAYYDELVQINENLAKAGVSSIKLVKIEWGPITLRDTTTAEATTYETWQTYYFDGSMDQGHDRNVYTLVQEHGAWKIQANDHPDADSGAAVGSDASAPSNPAVPSSPEDLLPPTTDASRSRINASRNWSGYAASGGSFTAVNGTWTVPEVQSTGSFGSGATWVGIGGVHSRDLIQAGTMETSSQSGRVHYEAWIEMLPRAAQPVPFTVGPGDSVTVSISEQETDLWLIAFENGSTGQSYETTVRYSSSHSSAEWVVEAPSAGRRLLPLDNFGTVQFSGGSTTRDRQSVTLAQAGAQPVTMIDARGNILAVPSALSRDGTGFSITRTAVPSTAQPFPGRRGS